MKAAIAVLVVILASFGPQARAENLVNTSTRSDTRIIHGLERDLYIAMKRADTMRAASDRELKAVRESSVDKDRLIATQREMIESRPVVETEVTPSWVLPVVLIVAVAGAALGAAGTLMIARPVER